MENVIKIQVEYITDVDQPDGRFIIEETSTGKTYQGVTGGDPVEITTDNSNNWAHRFLMS